MENILSNWREIWNERILHSCHSTLRQAQKWRDKNIDKFNAELLIDEHPKDGFVVYSLRK